MKNHDCCFNLFMYFAVHQHVMPSATAQVIFFSLHKLYHSPLIICLHWLPSCRLTPHFKLLILCLKTKHNLCLLFCCASPSSQQGHPQPVLLQQPLCFCFPDVLHCIPSASLYTTHIPFLRGFSQRYFTLFLSFLTPTCCCSFGFLSSL